MLVKVGRYPALAMSDIFGLRSDLHELLSGVLGGEQSPRSLPIDLVEEEGQYGVAVEVPGIRKDDIRISVQDGSMTISAERKGHEVPESSSWLRNEISTGKFSRTIPIPREVKVDAISAELVDGILHLVLPKSEKARTLEIAVK